MPPAPIPISSTVLAKVAPRIRSPPIAVEPEVAIPSVAVLTSNFMFGLVVPIPTLPFPLIVKISLDPTR